MNGNSHGGRFRYHCPKDDLVFLVEPVYHVLGFDILNPERNQARLSLAFGRNDINVLDRTDLRQQAIRQRQNPFFDRYGPCSPEMLDRSTESQEARCMKSADFVAYGARLRRK